jgi:hypothetical protein
MASDFTTASFIFKRKYADKKPGELAQRFHPCLQLIGKKDGFVGHDTTGTYFYAVRYANPQAISGSFANAQTVSTDDGASKGVQFGAKRKVKYGIIRIDGVALNASKGNDGAFIELVSMESEGVFEEMGDTLAFELHRDGTARRGTRSGALIDTHTVQLANVDDARNFKVGMRVMAAENTDGTSPRAGSTHVTAIDEDLGRVTLNDQGDITTFTAGDHLFRLGDIGSAVDGFESHLPLAAPSASEDFRTVDRSVDTRRLAGARVDDTATSIEENAGLVAIKIGQTGQKATHLLLNPIRFWEVARRLNAKVVYDGGGGKAGYGFEAFDVSTPAGTLKAVSDPDAPTDRGRVINIETWTWKHLTSPWIHSITDDKGGMFLRVHNADAIEGRIRTMGNTILWRPGANGTFSI